MHQMFELCLSKDHYVLEHTKGRPLEDPYASNASQLNTAALGDNANGNLMSKVTVTGSFNLGTLQSAMMIPLSHSPIGAAADVCQSAIVGGGGGRGRGGCRWRPSRSPLGGLDNPQSED